MELFYNRSYKLLFDLAFTPPWSGIASISAHCDLQLDIILILCYFKKKKGKSMDKERLILNTDNKGNLKGLPKFPPNKKVEAIFLIIDKPDQKMRARRSPHKDIAGKTRIIGNIFDTVCENEWNLPK